MDEELKPLIGLSLTQLQTVALEAGLRRFAGGQMARWLYQKRVRSIDEMTDLSKSARETLKERYCVGREEPLARVVSVDGTAKYLFRGAKSRDVESVMIPDGDRATLCISSQAGCGWAAVLHDRTAGIPRAADTSADHQPGPLGRGERTADQCRLYGHG